ncbi:hypothetical protein MTO96_000623 [Rhipicephalus appendiculatus]
MQGMVADHAQQEKSEPCTNWPFGKPFCGNLILLNRIVHSSVNSLRHEREAKTRKRRARAFEWRARARLAGGGARERPGSRQLLLPAAAVLVAYTTRSSHARERQRRGAAASANERADHSTLARRTLRTRVCPPLTCCSASACCSATHGSATCHRSSLVFVLCPHSELFDSAG